ncbi:MAG TPA: hypothetical protein VNW90_15160 [Acetobacteraceae bacterium]|nr:hypothetical protein [Acetobacteraceae bacterium]
MSDDPDLFDQIQAVLAGHTEKAVMLTLLKSLVVAIGVSAPDLPRAEALIDALPGEMKSRLLAEWPNYRAHRAKAEAIQSQREC